MGNSKRYSVLTKGSRARLSQEEADMLNLIRGVVDASDSLNIDSSIVKNGWLKGEGASLFFKNPSYVDPEGVDMEKLTDLMISQLNEYSPKYKKIKYQKVKDPHCLVFDPADIHIGKISSSFETGEEYDSQIAVQRVREGLNGILSKASGWNFDQIVFITGNDILHVDTPKSTTTSGTPQNVDGMWYDAFLMAKSLLVEIIETLMSVAPVQVIYNPSNHDYMSGFMLIDSIKSWFRKSKDVSFMSDMSHRKYYKYGLNMIATTHMDGGKSDGYPLLAAQESKMWDSTKHRYIYGHHVHHKKAKDYPGVTLETLRSCSSADSWHHRSLYQHAPKAVEGFIHHPEHGQIARLTHIF